MFDDPLWNQFADDLRTQERKRRLEHRRSRVVLVLRHGGTGGCGKDQILDQTLHTQSGSCPPARLDDCAPLWVGAVGRDQMLQTLMDRHLGRMTADCVPLWVGAVGRDQMLQTLMDRHLGRMTADCAPLWVGTREPVKAL